MLEDLLKELQQPGHFSTTGMDEPPAARSLCLKCAGHPAAGSHGSGVIGPGQQEASTAAPAPSGPPGSWTVRQLKQFLQEAGVDASSCIGKEELVELAQQQQQQGQQQQGWQQPGSRGPAGATAAAAAQPAAHLSATTAALRRNFLAISPGTPEWVAAADSLARKVDRLEGRLQQQGLEGMQDPHSKSEFAVSAGVGWRALNMQQCR